MITHLRGRLIEKNPAYLVVDVNGIGYHVNISLHTYSGIGNDENCQIHTHLVVREDAQILYGFSTREEREMFRQLISVSGVGASTAQMILSSLSPAEVHQAILDEDVNTLKQIKGIGSKSAQRVIVDLKDKMEKEEVVPTGSENMVPQGNTLKKEALSALVALGFDKKKAEKALKKQSAGLDENQTVEELVKVTLKNL